MLDEIGAGERAAHRGAEQERPVAGRARAALRPGAARGGARLGADRRRAWTDLRRGLAVRARPGAARRCGCASRPRDARGIAGVYTAGRVTRHEVNGDEVTIEAEIPERLCRAYREHLIGCERARGAGSVAGAAAALACAPRRAPRHARRSRRLRLPVARPGRRSTPRTRARSSGPGETCSAGDAGAAERAPVEAAARAVRAAAGRDRPRLRAPARRAARRGGGRLRGRAAPRARLRAGAGRAPARARSGAATRARRSSSTGAPRPSRPTTPRLRQRLAELKLQVTEQRVAAAPRRAPGGATGRGRRREYRRGARGRARGGRPAPGAGRPARRSRATRAGAVAVLEADPSGDRAGPAAAGASCWRRRSEHERRAGGLPAAARARPAGRRGAAAGRASCASAWSCRRCPRSTGASPARAPDHARRPGGADRREGHGAGPASAAAEPRGGHGHLGLLGARAHHQGAGPRHAWTCTRTTPSSPRRPCGAATWRARSAQVLDLLGWPPAPTPGARGHVAQQPVLRRGARGWWRPGLMDADAGRRLRGLASACPAARPST